MAEPTNPLDDYRHQIPGRLMAVEALVILFLNQLGPTGAEPFLRRASEAIDEIESEAISNLPERAHDDLMRITNVARASLDQWAARLARPPG